MNLKGILKEYGEASGQCVNYDKFSIYFSSNVREEYNRKFQEVWGFWFLLILRDIWAYRI